MKTIKKIIKAFQSECNYRRINDISTVKMRNNCKGIKLFDVLYYKFLYSKKNVTKEQIVSIINNINNTTFTRQAFEYKENNIPLQTYLNICKKIFGAYNRTYINPKKAKIIAIDGTYNNDINMKQILNMGFYDVTNEVPISIESCGKGSKNQEIFNAIKYIKDNIDTFKNNIIVVDRAYFSYDFIEFLNNNNLMFIIRAKGTAKNLLPNTQLRKSLNKYNKILKIRKNIRVINYNDIIKKTIYSRKKKKETKKHVLEIKNNCVVITNIMDKKKYNDNKVLELYRSRWDIEVYFKYIKGNYKFQSIKEKSQLALKKMCICEQIITYIAKLIEKYYTNKFSIKKQKGSIYYKINRSNLINGIFDNILHKVLNNKLTAQSLNKFCRTYIRVIQNKRDRTFPRTSKTPFSKWYIKGYSNITKYMRIINAITNNSIDSLNKNLKMIAKRIISINDITIDMT